MHASKQSIGKTASAGRGVGGISHSTNPSVAETARLANLRRSTPDSEAIMSSDDEHDLSRSVQSLASKSARQPGPSGEVNWLNDIQSGPPRRPSATTTTSNISQPNTPLDQAGGEGAWPFQNTLGRVASNPVTTSWNSASPWGNVQSRMYPDDKGLPRGELREGSAPYSMPLQPTPKTYRSQSYSVGQMESELSAAAAAQGQNIERQRTTPSQQLPHRPSRPSMLSGVYEGDPAFSQERYEPESYSQRGATSPMSPEGRRENVVESLHNNNLLRHATKSRSRHGQSASASDTRGPTALHSAYQPHPAQYATEQVIDEEPENYTTAGLTRRFSELTGLGGPGEAARRGQWQTSLGFGNLPEIPQSRRHSMAEMPTRRNSLVAAAADQGVNFSPTNSTSPVLGLSDPHQAAMQETYQRTLQDRSYAASYFSGVGPALRSRLESTQSPISGGGHGMHSPPQGLFSRPGQDTPLFIVSFKCARAEVYYVAENTGLQVKDGDLVIVEADRGHDLGTVLYSNVSWEQAREMKNKANEEHYRWLMMFSRHNQTSEGISSGGTGGMMAGSAPDRTPQPPGPAPHIFNPGMIDPGHRESDLKPKMIKRLAQPHEVATLRDKEGNEAKAKRICQQKVNEMKLDMEILDAEFQTDWKKLTFFYYANSYVNFNALVTDLFKIYKTRIWMSAINPASLNTAPVPPPRGLGPGAVSGRESAMGGGRGGAPRPYSSNMGFGGDQYGAAPMYQNVNTPTSYDYNDERGSAGHSQSSTPAQQAFNMMQQQAQHGGGYQDYNSSMQSYGWGSFGGPPGPQYGGMGGSFSGGPMTYGSGLGPPGSRGTPGGQSGGFNMPGRGPAPVDPISPPGAQGQYRK